MARYEQDWARNPFTLKTAPAALEKHSFARDLALGGIDNLGDGHRVVLVNIKTQQRFPVKEGVPSSDGLAIRSVHRATSLKDTFVEIERNGEVAQIRYDEDYLKKIASTSPGAASAPKDRKTASVSSAQSGTPSPSVSTNPATGPAASPPASAPRSASPALASHTAAAATSGSTGRSESVTVRQRRRVQTVPNTP